MRLRALVVTGVALLAFSAAHARINHLEPWSPGYDAAVPDRPLSNAAMAINTQMMFTIIEGYAWCISVLKVKKTPPSKLLMMYRGEPLCSLPLMFRK